MSVANPLEERMLELINQERAVVGVAALAFNGELNQSSEVHSQWMLEQDVFNHTGDGGSSAQERMEAAGYPFEGAWASGENIAFQSLRGEEGVLDDVADLHTSLMNSPGHRANILNPTFTEIGIGLEEGMFTSDGTDFDSLMVTQNFATTDAELDAPEVVPVPDPVEPEPEVVADVPDPEPVPVEPDVVADVPEPDVVDEAPEPDVVAEAPEPEVVDEEPDPVPVVDDTPAPEEDETPVAEDTPEEPIDQDDVTDDDLEIVVDEAPVVVPVVDPVEEPELEPEPVADTPVPEVEMDGCPAPFMLTDDMMVPDAMPSANPDAFVFTFAPVNTPNEFFDAVTEFLSVFIETAFDQFEEAAPQALDAPFEDGPLWLGEWSVEWV